MSDLTANICNLTDSPALGKEVGSSWGERWVFRRSETQDGVSPLLYDTSNKAPQEWCLLPLHVPDAICPAFLPPSPLLLTVHAQ